VLQPTIRFSCAKFVCLIALLLPFSGLTRAQDATSTASQQSSGDAKPAGRSGAVGVVQPSGDDQSSTNSGAPPIQELGRGGWLGEASPLHWGSLYIGSFDFTEGYDDFRSAAANSLTGVFHTSVLSTTVVFNPRLSRTNLAFQWHPQVGFVNGKFASNLTNQDVSFDLATLLTPRFSVRLQNHFSYVPAQNVFAEGFLYAAVTPQNNSVQASFLDGPGIWLTDSALVSFGYALNPTTDLIVSPSFNYAHLLQSSSALGGTINATPAPLLIGSQAYAATANLSHRLSPLKTIGLFYSLNAVKFEETTSYTTYNTIGGSYSQQLSPTWFVTGSAGASNAAFSGGGTKTWTFSGTGQVQKTFQRSSLALAYTRGLSLNQYASRNYTDRVDLTFGSQLTQRLSAQLGFGYQRVNGPPLLSGKYVNPQLGFQLLPSLKFLATYIYRDQVGDTTQVFSETRQTAYLTLSWDPLHHIR